MIYKFMNLLIKYFILQENLTLFVSQILIFIMMKKQTQTKKLVFKKLQLTKINNLQKILGGTQFNQNLELEGGDGCKYPENASKQKDDSLHI